MEIKIVRKKNIVYQGEVFNSNDYSELTNRYPKNQGYKYITKRGCKNVK